MEKAPIRDYRDLIVWQKAMDLAVACETVAVELSRLRANKGN